MSTDNPPLHLGTGINASHERTVGRMGRYLIRYHRVKCHDLRYKPAATWISANRFATVDRVATQILDQVKPGDHYLAHSWHCNPLHLAMTRGLKLGTIFLFSPAAPKTLDWSKLQFDRLFCLHNPRDYAVLAGSILPNHLFGLAGVWGFDQEREDERINNIQAHMTGFGFNHSHYFQQDLAYWSDWVHDKLTAPVNCCPIR